MTDSFLESVFRWTPAQWAAGLAFLMRARVYRLLRMRYRALQDDCWVARVCPVPALKRVALRSIRDILERTQTGAGNPLIEWYLRSNLSRRCAASFTLSGGGPNDLFRDLIVLKSPSAAERGVILLKYARTFEAVVALLDVERLRKRYYFVLEPCWAGYCDTALLMHYSPGHPVVVQCFTDEDHEFIGWMGPPMQPVRLGPADWVNAETFRHSSSIEKTHDLVMVANWGAHKRHRQLFRALRSVADRPVRVLLVGFPWAGRTAEDIRREARELLHDNVTLEIVESVPHDQLARLVAGSRVFVFLSRKEGDNKALVEAMFANVPAIVYDRSVGGARSRINPATGVLSADEELPEKIRFMLEHYRDFSARDWALSHTGSAVATRIVDGTLLRAAQERGEPYRVCIAEKINAPNLAYRNPEARARFQADYDFIASCLRERPVA